MYSQTVNCGLVTMEENKSVSIRIYHITLGILYGSRFTAIANMKSYPSQLDTASRSCTNYTFPNTLGGGFTQPKVQSPGSKIYSICSHFKSLFEIPMFMQRIGSLASTVPTSIGDTGRTVFLRTLFPGPEGYRLCSLCYLPLSLGLTVHIKPYEYRSIDESSDSKIPCEELSAEDYERFEYGGYVGDEIF